MRRLLLKALKRIHTGVIKMEKAGLTTGLNDKGLVWIDLEVGARLCYACWPVTAFRNMVGQVGFILLFLKVEPEREENRIQ